MKKLLLFLSLAVCYFITNAQTSNWLWAESSNGGSYEYGFGVFVDTGGQIFTSGRISSSGTFGGLSYNLSGNTSPYVEEFDTSGSGVWVNGTAFTGFDYSEGFGIDYKDNTYVTGIEGCSLPVAKFNKAGSTLWAKTFSGTCLAGEGITADNAGYVYVVGTMNSGSFTMGSVTLSYPGSAQGIFLAKLDSNGNCIWGKTIYGTGSNDGTDQPRDVVVDNQGYIYFIGDYFGSPLFGTVTVPVQTGGVQNFFIAKYDTAGNPVWVTTSTNSFGCDFGGSNGIALDSCNNIYVTGAFENTAQFGNFSFTSAGNEDGFVAKLNISGQWQWVNTISSSGRDAGFSICTDKHNEVFVGGDYGGAANLGNGVTISGGGGGFVAKYANSTGQAEWALGGIGSTNGHVYGMAVDKWGYAYALGDFVGTVSFGSHTVNCTNGTSNIFLAKLDTVAPRIIIPEIAKSYCPVSTDSISYTIVGSFNSGNTFTVQLSDSSGSFVNDTSIGSVISTDSGKIGITIPAGTPPGSNYLIRIVSSNPGTSSYVNGCGAYYSQNVYPNDFYVTIGGGTIAPSISPLDTTVCPGASVNLTASGGATYLWNNSDTASVITVNPTITSTFIVTASSGCGTGSDTAVITVDTSAQLLDIEPQGPLFCSGLSDTLYVNGTGSSFTWSPSAGLSTTTGDTVVASPIVTTTYIVMGTTSGGCAATGTDIVTIVTSPNKPTFYQHGDTLISSSKYDNQWYYNGTMLNDTSQDLIITTTGQYWVNVSNEANGCSTTSDTTLVDTVNGIYQVLGIIDQISIYPNPFNNTVFTKINSSVGNVKDWNLQITDVLGRTVYSKQSLDYSNAIDLSNLANGVYFITVINKTTRAVFDVVKQNQ